MMEFKNLDERTRMLMIKELEMDIDNGSLYLSSRLNEKGFIEYIEILRTAITKGNSRSFADELRHCQCLKRHEERQKPKGGFTMVKVPINAADTLAEGEFNRFYIRALCRRAIEDGIDHLVVYRAKEVRNPRYESERLIGKSISVHDLLDDLRTHIGVDTVLGLPAGPNSGLSVMIPEISMEDRSY
jgi:hypothetical protein